MKKLVALLLICGGCVSPNAEAELATFEAIAPEYTVYVEGDETLTAEQKQLRLDTVETWRRRVEVGK